jgi:hypothetical protein
MLGKHAKTVLELEPGYRVNKLIRDGQKAGGFRRNGQPLQAAAAGQAPAGIQ